MSSDREKQCLLELKAKIEEVKEHLIKDLEELERIIVKFMGGAPQPPDWMIPRIFVWYEVYQKGGIVTREELHDIVRKYYNDVRPLGAFFTGKEPSLRLVGINRDKVALEHWAAREVEKYKEWLDSRVKEKSFAQ